MRLIVFFFLFSHSFSISSQKNFNLEFLAQVKHPVETNDIWGYVDDDGTEYAIVGTEIDCRIYSLKDPNAPALTGIIPGATSIWRDFKTYGHYIYQITQRGEDGLRIIDMTLAPDTITSRLFSEELTIGGKTTALKTCHNLWIDTLQGIAYLAGCNPGIGGIIMLDIATDPMNPRFIGAEDERYSHDVITRGDTLFASEINEGMLGIYDISNKNAPQLISRTQTSSSFTHNAWISDDGNYVFTTDERPNAFIDSYDIREIERPTRLDQYQVVKNGNVIPHNTHYKDGYLVTSWYTEGVVIVDAHRPANLVKVGQYDTYTLNATGFNGAWGAYPYLPSELLLVSDITGGLIVLQPKYRRASYLEGTISDAVSGAAINAAFIHLDDTEKTVKQSKANGIFKTGTANAGNYQVIIDHPDYESDTVNVVLTEGEVTEIKVRLFRRGSVRGIAGQIQDTEGNPIPEAKLFIQASFREIQTSSDEDGYYRAVLPLGQYDIYVASWGYKGKLVKRSIKEGLQDPIILEQGYEDDFFVDLGWKVSGDAKKGVWIRDIPKATFFNGKLSNPAGDLENDLGSFCFITGNNDATVGADDVDDGATILTSPPINLSDKRNPIIEITPWFFNGGGDSPPNDTMNIYLKAGNSRTLVQSLSQDFMDEGHWRDPILIEVDKIYKREKSVSIEIEVLDLPGSGHLVEGGIDRFRMYEGPLPIYPDDQAKIEVIVAPNPTNGILFFEPKTNEKVLQLRIFDISGKLLLKQPNPELELSVDDFPSGVYVLDFLFGNGISSQISFQKI